MKLTLVSHSSVIVDTGETRIWTDPWLHGKAFNESWSLFPPAAFDPAWLDGIDYVWLSHEHPDHFHIPTLRSLPEAFKKRVTILYQHNNSEKLRKALAKFGFPNFVTMPHRKVMRLGRHTEVYCYQVEQMDSVLAVDDGRHLLVNVNDSEVTEHDCQLMRRDLGEADVVLNQFSIAGYGGEGNPKVVLPRYARRILEGMRDAHVRLGAEYTVPIASFVYFCREDNAYLNQYANSPVDVAECLAEQQLKTAMLRLGETWDLDEPWDQDRNRAYYRDLYATLPQQPVWPSERCELPEIAQAFHERVGQLQDRFPSVVLRRLEPVVAYIGDLGVTVRFSILEDRFETVDTPREQADLIVNSQPLHYAFRFPWGVQTLGGSARLIVQRKERNWYGHRILFSLDNAEVYLNPRYLLRQRTLMWLWQRRHGAVGQLRSRIDRMREPMVFDLEESAARPSPA